MIVGANRLYIGSDWFKLVISSKSAQNLNELDSIWRHDIEFIYKFDLNVYLNLIWQVNWLKLVKATKVVRFERWSMDVKLSFISKKFYTSLNKNLDLTMIIIHAKIMVI